MGLASMVGKNITGTVDKAYILLHKPSRDEDLQNDDNSTIKSYMSRIAAVGESLSNAASKAIGQEANLSDALEGINTEGKFFPMEVQYNPATLHFSSSSGMAYNQNPGVGGNGSGQFQVFNVPYEAVLHMELIFDATVNSKAFSVTDSGIASPTGAVKGLAGLPIYNKVTTGSASKTYSVQNVSELFVSAICNAYSRPICVAWNKTIFWGELCGATVEYTMFDNEGNPIRSKVHLKIRQDDRANPSDMSWEKTYNNFFDAAEKLQKNKKLTSSSSMVSSILNLKN